MSEKTPHSSATTEAVVETKNPPNNTAKKTWIDTCVSNPGFPWMVIAILFTLLVIMFWREHYYGYGMWMMRDGNAFYRNNHMMDDDYGQKDPGMYQKSFESTNTGMQPNMINRRIDTRERSTSINQKRFESTNTGTQK